MTAMRLKRYPSPSGGIALGKMGVGARMMLSAKDYNYDLALWDAIENAGYGIHNPSATSITNLLGGGLDIALSGNYTVNANNIRFNGGYGIADKYNFTAYNGVTISVLASYDSTTTPSYNAQGWTYAGDDVPRLAAYWERGGWYMSAPVNVARFPPKILDSITVGQIVKHDFIWNLTDKTVSVFKNGTLVGSNSSYDFYFASMVNHFRLMAYGSASDTNSVTYNGNIYNCAVSTRALSASEIAANYAIDKERFNLP